MSEQYIAFAIAAVCSMALSICLGILLCRHVRGSRERRDLLLCVALGEFVSFTLLSVPGQLAHGYNCFNAIAQAMHHVMQAVAINASYEMFEEAFKLASPDRALTILEQTYILYAMLLQLSMPFLIAGYLFASIRRIMERTAYCLRIPKGDVYVFSELNQRSVYLGESIRANCKHATIVYTGVHRQQLYEAEGEGLALLGRIKEIRGVCIQKSLEARCRYKPSKGCALHLLFIMEKDARACECLLNTMKSPRMQKNIAEFPVDVYLFSMEAEAEHIVDYAAATYPRARFRLVNELRLMVYDLFRKYPLYEGVPDKAPVSVLIVGGGKVGSEALKTVAWLGQSLAHPLKINVIDIDAKRLEDTLRQQCPELLKEGSSYHIAFHPADISCGLDAALANCADTTYAIVSLGNDNEQNISAALYLRRYFARLRMDQKPEMPSIHVVMNDPAKHDMLKLLLCNDNETSWYFNLRAFGSLKELYSYGTAIQSESDRNALMLHCIKENVVKKMIDLLQTAELPHSDGDAIDRLLCVRGGVLPDKLRHIPDTESCVAAIEKQLGRFERNEYFRQSSAALYLHMATKLNDCAMLRGTEAGGLQATIDWLDSQATEYQKLSRQEGAKDADPPRDPARGAMPALDMTSASQNPIIQLAVNEHTRWYAYMSTIGFRAASVGAGSDMQRYQAITGSHKHFIAQLHACLTPWDALDAVDKAVDACNGDTNSSNFRSYDIVLISCIPNIFNTIMKANGI